MTETNSAINLPYLYNIAQEKILPNMIPTKSLSEIVKAANETLQQRGKQAAIEQMSTEDLKLILSRCSNALNERKFGIRDNTAARNFAYKLSRLIGEINESGFKVWYSPCNNKLFLSKQGLIIAYRPDGFIDSNKVLLTASDDEIESMEDEDYQFVPEK